jgi:hypothetical protein
VFEFLAEALGKEQLEEEWMKRAAARLTAQFKATRPINIECARLFHAAHGLVLYREKVFGPRGSEPNSEARHADVGRPR